MLFLSYSSVVGDKCIKKGESFLKKIKFTSCIPGKDFTYKETVAKLRVSISSRTSVYKNLYIKNLFIGHKGVSLIKKQKNNIYDVFLIWLIPENKDILLMYFFSSGVSTKNILKYPLLMFY